MSVPHKLSFCSFTAPKTTFEDDVELAVKHGFAGLSVGEQKLDDPDKDDERVRLFKESGLRATACIPISISTLRLDPPAPHLFSAAQDPEELVKGMCASIERLAKFDPYSVVVITGAAPERGASEERSLAVEGLREAARVAAKAGTRISIEILRMEGFSTVHDLPKTIQLIEDIGESNVDIAYDIWHMWDSPDVLALTEQYAKQVGTVHIDDWLTDPPEEFDRGWPGDGIAEIPAMLAALERGGFSSWYDMEVFKSEFESMPPEAPFEQARESWDRTWKAVEALV
jgi:sugar phosphate isomerase/epimerase